MTVSYLEPVDNTMTELLVGLFDANEAAFTLFLTPGLGQHGQQHFR